jgi:hypothetical protein
MDIYSYVNKTNNVISIEGITIQPLASYSSTTSVLALDKLDGILVDKYLNGVSVANNGVEFNSYNIIVASNAGAGTKFDATNPQYGWHDMLSPTSTAPGSAIEYNTFIGSIKEYQFQVNNETFHQFHMLHDYAPGTDIYIHVHWSHNSDLVTGGSLTWNIEATYSKGYNQGVFSTPVNVPIVVPAVTTKYKHTISEVKLSAPGGAGGLLDSNMLETDGIIKVRLSLEANTTGANPFLFFCDAHYQSTGIPTKNKNYNFWN